MNNAIELRQLRAHAACVKGRTLRLTMRAIKVLESGKDLDASFRETLYRALVKDSSSGNWCFVLRTTADN